MIDELTTLRQRVAELEEEVAFLRDERRLDGEAEQTARVARRFGLTPGEAWIVLELYRAGGRTVRISRLAENMPGKAWEERDDAYSQCRVQIHRIRRKMGAEAVQTEPGGYTLTEQGISAVRQVGSPS